MHAATRREPNQSESDVWVPGYGPVSLPLSFRAQCRSLGAPALRSSVRTGPPLSGGTAATLRAARWPAVAMGMSMSVPRILAVRRMPPLRFMATAAISGVAITASPGRKIPALSEGTIARTRVRPGRLRGDGILRQRRNGQRAPQQPLDVTQ